MKRSIGFGIVVLIIATMAFGPASAQDKPDATVSALQTQVAELKATVSARGEKINVQRTQIAELKGRVSELEALVPTPTPEPALPQLGVTVHSEHWEIVVSSTSLLAQTGQGNATQTAKGVYLAIEIVLTNTSNSPDDFPILRFRAIDSDQRTYSPDFMGSYMLNNYVYDYAIPACTCVQPGIPYTVAIAFDVPIDASGFVLTTENKDFRVILDR